MDETVYEMLQNSNWIEREMSSVAMDDAVEAWEYAVKNANNITTNYVLKIHKLMQKNLRADIAGKFRDCDVYIGGECRRFISEDVIRAGVKEVTDAMIDKIPRRFPVAEKEALAKATHIRFEKIHPHEDGNGRVGRILYNVHRLLLGLPIHIIHEGDEQMEYYKWFRD